MSELNVIKNSVIEDKNTVTETADAVNVEETSPEAKGMLSGTMHDIGRRTSEAWEDTKEAISPLVEKTKEEFVEAVQAAKDMAGNTKEAFDNSVKQTDKEEEISKEKIESSIDPVFFEQTN